MRQYGVFFSVLILLLFGFAWRSTEGAEKQLEQKMNCQTPIQSGLLKDKIKGMSLVAPPNPFPSNPIIELQQLGTDWVAILPYAYFGKNQPFIQSFSKGGWWGERPEGVCKTIAYAQKQAVKTMLKPQLWTHNQWIGDLDFEREKDWKLFEKNYQNWILKWALIADSMEVDLFCIGTEIRHSVKKRPNFWKTLIQKIRAVYKGKLTYAPNWDDYKDVNFWNQLDYIGTDAYFPLSEKKTPSVCDLKKAWKPIVKELALYAKQWGKPILFTEFGYLSLDACAYKTWELEKNRSSVAINEQAQANALQALLEIFATQDWWAGGFQWKWYPNYKSAMGEGNRERDYTPQGKLAERVLSKMYKDQ